MITVLPFKYPSCGAIDHEGLMPRWKKLGDVELHVCLECQNKGMTDEQLLRVGIKAGWNAYQQEQQRCDREFKQPDIPSSPFLKWKAPAPGEYFGEWI